VISENKKQTKVDPTEFHNQLTYVLLKKKNVLEKDVNIFIFRIIGFISI
jgi:hypothetical protein